MLDRGLTLGHAIGDAVNLLNIWGLGLWDRGILETW
jgi:hypothetical protein